MPMLAEPPTWSSASTPTSTLTPRRRSRLSPAPGSARRPSQPTPQASRRSWARWARTRAVASGRSRAPAATAPCSRFLHERGEQVVELDRPSRPARHNGATSDTLDAVRAARGRRAGGPVGAARRPPLGRRRPPGRPAATARPRGRRTRAAARPLPGSEHADDGRRRRPTAHRRPPARRVPGDGGRPALPGTARPRAAGRGTAPRAHDRGDGARLAPRRAPRVRCRPARGGRRAVRVVASRARPLRGCVRQPRRCCARARIVGHDRPAPAHRFGDRQLNRALHTVVLCRLRYDPGTRAYAERRRAAGKTDREIKRCLKRYVARQLFHLLEGGTRSTP